jgi:hypothetical protein
MQEGQKYRDIYFEVNALSLIVAVSAFVSAIYIQVTLRTNKIFNKTIYLKFMMASFVINMLFLLILVYFILSYIKLTKMDLKLWIEVFHALSLMSSDNTGRMVFEIVLTFWMILGFYALIILSNMIEEDIIKLEEIKNKGSNFN